MAHLHFGPIVVVTSVHRAQLAVLIALPVAYVLWKSGLRYAKVFYLLGVTPFILPPVILTLAFMRLLSVTGMNGFILNVVIAHAVFLLALPLVTISLGRESVDESILEAAQTMGADSKTVFRTVVFPIAAPFALAGFAFVLCSV